MKSHFLFLALLLLVSGVALTFRVAKVPPNFNQDELGFALNAYSVSKNLTDTAGTFLPVYLKHLGFMWATPVTGYWGAAFLRFLTLSITSVRRASASVGLIDIGLFYFLAKEVFSSRRLAVAGAFLLAITPAHLINSRIFIDNIFITPFVILWLYFLVKFLNNGRPINFILASFVLGLGGYSYVSATIMMPFYFFLSCLLIFPQIRRQPQIFLAGLFAFGLPHSLDLIQLHRFSQTYAQRASSFNAYDNFWKTALSQPLSLRNIFNGLGTYFHFYTLYFDPIFLFWRGDGSLIHSTGRFGVFLPSTLPFFLIGLVRLIKKRTDRINQLILFGLLTYPLAGAMIFEPYRISRALNVIPFYLLICLAGLKVLFDQRGLWLRVGWGLVGLTGLLFLIFLGDYFYRYPARASASFRGGLPDAFRTIVNLEKSGAYQKLYVDQEIAFADYYFRFFQIEQEDDKCPPLQLVNRQNLPILSGNGLLLTKASEPIPVGQDGNLHWRLIENFPGPSFTEKYFLYGAL